MWEKQTCVISKYFFFQVWCKLGADYMRKVGYTLAHLGLPKTNQVWKYILYNMVKICPLHEWT